MYSHATWNYWVPNPNLSLCSNEAFLPPSWSVTPPGTGEKEWRGLKGRDGHKCSSSSPLPLSKAVFLWGGFHCYCLTVGAACSPPRVSAIWLKHELNLTPGARFDSHTHTLTGHAASPWPHYEKVSQSLRPKIDFSAVFSFFCSELRLMRSCYVGLQGIAVSDGQLQPLEEEVGVLCGNKLCTSLRENAEKDYSVNKKFSFTVWNDERHEQHLVLDQEMNKNSAVKTYPLQFNATWASIIVFYASFSVNLRGRCFNLIFKNGKK